MNRRNEKRKTTSESCRLTRLPGSRPSLLVLFITAFFVLPTLHAQSDARQIVEEAQRRAQSKSQRYEGLLQVLDSRGKVADKRWLFTRLGSHGRSKAVLRFVAPAEVKGVALLIVNHPDRASDQWMWTPALQRERRIALQDRSTRFFGTDFSFEDLEERDVDQYDYRLVGDETIDGAPCWRIESTPSQKKISQYTKSEVWIRKDNYALAQVESYVKTEVVRRLTYSDFVQAQGIWTGRRLEMTDLRRKSRTILTLEKLEYAVPLKDEDFTLQALRNPL
jgi:Outer membrane lipoprotein-sorting protein